MLKKVINSIPRKFPKIQLACDRYTLQNKSLTYMLIHLAKFECSQIRRISLADVEQRAVIAYFALLYIQQFQGSMYINGQLSIRQNLTNRVIFQKFILSKVKQLFSHQKSTLNIVEIGLEHKNIDVVMCAFEIDKGVYYDQAIYSSANFSDSYNLNLKEQINPTDNQNEYSQQKNKFQVSHNISNWQNEGLGRTVLHPFLHTGIILRCITQINNRIIYGDKGIGKSFTYLLYSHLSSFIIESRIQNEHNNLQKYLLYQRLLTVNGIFYQAKKLFYVPIKVLSLSDLKSIFQPQIVGKYQKDLIKQHYKQLQPNIHIQKSEEYDYYLNQISKIFRNREIQLLLVVDDTNYYYSLAEKVFMGLEKQNQQIKIRFLALTEMLKYIQFNLQPFILNTSIDIQRHQLQLWMKRYDFFDFCDNGNTHNNNIKIGYSDSISGIEGVLQLYGLFFFEISKAMIMINKSNKFRLNFLKQCMAKKMKNLSQNSNSSQNSWKAYIKPLYMRQKIDQITKQPFDTVIVASKQQILAYNKRNLISILADQLKNQDQNAIWKTLMKIKQKIEGKGLLQITQIFQKYVKNNFIHFSDQDADHLIMGVHFCAYQLLDRPYKQFQISLKKILKLQNIRTFFVGGQPTPLYLLKQISNQWTFAHFNEENLTLEVHCSPREFIQQSELSINMIKRQPYNYDLLSKVYMKYKHMLTGSQFEMHLIWFAYRLFRRGFCQLSFQQCSIQNQQLVKLKQNYHIQNNFIFQSLSKTKDINCSLKKLFSFVENNCSQKYQCAAAYSGNNEGFDFMLCRKRSQDSPFQLITFDLLAGEVFQKINESTNEKKLAVGESQHQLLKFFSNANLSNNGEVNEIDNLIDEIQNSLRQKIDVSGLVSFVQNLSNKEKHEKMAIQIKKLCRINLRQIFQKPIIISLVALELRQILSMNNMFNLLKGFGVSELYNQTRIKKQLRIQKLLQKLLKNSPQDFILNCSILIGQAALFANMQKSFKTKKQIITFLRGIYSKQSQTNEFKYLIPEKLQGDSGFNELLEKHRFLVPFKNLRQFSKGSGLQLTHIIAVPEYRAEQYIKYVESSKKQFLYKDYTNIEDGRVEKLKFKLASLKLDDTTLTLKDSGREFDYNSDAVMKEQYGFIKTLMSIMMEKQVRKQ